MPGDELRRPFLLGAVLVLFLVVCVELGSSFTLRTPQAGAARLAPELAQMDDDVRDDAADGLGDLERGDDPPGFAIPSMALLDGLLLYTVGLMALALVVPDALQGRVQGIVSLVVSFIVAILCIILIVVAFAGLLAMVALFLAAPFGTIAYLGLFGFFNRAGSMATLGFLLLLKLGFVVLLVMANQRFLAGKGLVAMVLTSLLANLIVGFLHGIVPGFLVSITDLLAAVIVGILALVWAVLMLVGSIVSIVKVIIGIRAGRQEESDVGPATPVAAPIARLSPA